MSSYSFPIDRRYRYGFAGTMQFFNMVIAVATIHLQNGFFMNWSGQQQGEGMEFFVFAIVIGLVVVIAGPGKYALDARIARLSSAA